MSNHRPTVSYENFTKPGFDIRGNPVDEVSIEKFRNIFKQQIIF